MDRRRLPGELQRAHCEPDRMAGKGRWTSAARGPGNRPGIAWHGTQCRAHLEHAGGAEMPRASRGTLARFLRFLLLAAALLAATTSSSFGGEKIIASRVWPAQEYTRVTLESARPLRFQHFFVNDPDRLVLDLEGSDLGDELKGLPAKVGTADPYIQAVRVGVNRPGVVRVVFDLRTEVKPSVFALAPAREYKCRLVLDIFPGQPPDPLPAPVTPQAHPIGEVSTAPVMESPPELPEAARPEPPPAPPALTLTPRTPQP